MSRSRMGDAGLLARYAASALFAPIALALLIGVASAAAVAAPRAVAALHTAALHEQIETAPPGTIDLLASTADRPPSDRTWETVLGAVERIRSELPLPLGDVFGPADGAVTTGPFPVSSAASAPGGTTMRVRPTFAPGLESAVRYLEGGAPAAVTAGPGAGFEISLSAPTAEAMDWAVGETRTLAQPDAEFEVTLSGVWEPVDPDDAVWGHVLGALEPNIVRTLGGRDITAAAVVDADSWAAFAQTPGAVRLEAWLPVEVDRVDAADTAALLPQLGEVASRSFEIGPGGIGEQYFVVGAVPFTTGLPLALERAALAAGTVDQVLVMTASGPIGVAIAVIVLGARVVFERRRPSLELAAARGAGPRELRTILILDGLAVGVPAALLGGIAGLVAVPADAGPGGWLVVAAFAATPAVLLAGRAASLSPLRRARSDLGTRRSPLRWVVESVVVLLAAVSVWLLWQRGLANPGAGVDPVLAAVPLLLALAACVLVLRVYPVPLRGIARAAGRGRGLVSMLGATRALRDPAAGLAPVLALVVGVSIALFSGILLSTVQAGVDQAAAQRVGAELRLDATPLPAATVDALRDADGVRAVAPVYATRPVLLEVRAERTPVNAIVVDVAELAEVQRGSDTALGLPESLADVPADDTLPIVLSQPVADRIGESDARIEGRPIRTVEVREGLTPFGTRANWVLIDRANADGVVPTLVPQTVLIALDPGADPEAVARELAEIVPGASIASPARASAELRAGATIAGVTIALVAAIVAASILCAIAVALTLVMGGPARRRLLPLLGTLGLRSRQARALVIWEIAPVAAIAVLVGGVLGALLPVVVTAGLDLRPFTGGSVQPPLAVDPLVMALVVGAFVVSVVGATWIAVRLTRGAAPARALREETEG